MKPLTNLLGVKSYENHNTTLHRERLLLFNCGVEECTQKLSSRLMQEQMFKKLLSKDNASKHSACEQKDKNKKTHLFSIGLRCERFVTSSAFEVSS